MKPIEIAEGIYGLSLNVKDILFEEMWTIPNGVTLNSYLVKGDKLALIDGVCGWEGVPEQLFDLLDQLEVKLEDVDYIVINHMEPDHSGWIEDMKRLKPNVQIYCTRMASRLLENFFGITEGVHVIKSGDTVDLGAGKVLEFIQHPNVHWPDTMFTLEHATKTLFTCDMFGSFGVCEGNYFDDQFSEADRAYFEEEQIRYYSNVLVTFNKAAQMAVDKTRALEPRIIAPGHGPIYRKDPDALIETYDRICQFLGDAPMDEVALLWGSMYGMTEQAVASVRALLEENEVRFSELKVPQTSVGTIISKCLRAKAIIVAAPTYENNLFPPMVAALDELGKKKIIGKKALYIGSYGWSGGGNDEFVRTIEHLNMDWELSEPITFNGAPKASDLSQIRERVLELI